MGEKKPNGVKSPPQPVFGNGQTKKRAGDTNGSANGNAAKRQRIETRTDYTRWRMRDDESRHSWHYLEDDDAAKEWSQSVADKYYLGLPLVCKRGTNSAPVLRC